MECESIYSSASALALARYRASLPTPDNVITNTGYNHELSRMSSTTSFSSASSLARHRIQRQSVTSSSRSTGLISSESIPMSSNTTNSEDVALVWQPDPESTGSDPAANLWMEIEARLNRGRVGVGEGVGMRDERGQWVLTRQRHRQVQDRQVAQQDDNYGDERKNDGGEEYQENDSREEEQEEVNGTWELGSEEMKKQSSEFTVSAYFDPDLSTPRAPPLSGSFTSRSSSHIGRETETGRGVDMEGTAIFNMSAPLIASSSSTSGSGLNVGATPANTPLIHYETIQRVSRVRKSYSGSISGSTRMFAVGSISLIGPRSRGRSDSSSAVVDLDQRNVPESIPMICNTTDREGRREGMKSGMIRLDSHVQAALEVLSDDPDSPLDIDITAQSTYLDHGEGISPYTEMNESTPMPIPIPYHHTHTRSYSHHDQDRVSPDTHSTPNVEEVGLGIGMNLHLDSIYSLPVSSPLSGRKTSHSSFTSEVSEGRRSTDSSSVGPMSSETSMSSRGESQDSHQYPHSILVGEPTVEICEREKNVVGEEQEEMLTVTDLDTGHRVDLSIKRLDELWRI